MPLPQSRIKLPKPPRGHRSTSIEISNYAGGPPFTYIDQAGYDATVARVKKNTKIIWTTKPSTVFALIYEDDVTTTPGNRSFHSDHKNMVQVPVRGKKSGGDSNNTYKYNTAVLLGKKLKIHDPQVIIDD